MKDEPNVFTRVAQIWEIPMLFDAETVCEFDSVYDLSIYLEETCRDLFGLDDMPSDFLANLTRRAWYNVDWFSLAETAWINAGMNETED